MNHFVNYLVLRWPVLLELAWQHLLATAIAVAAAGALALIVGIATYRSPGASHAALEVANIFITIPSFALFGLLIPILGLGYPPTVVALTMYGILPILRNTIVGLQNVDPAVVEAARGMGLRRREILWQVELPLATPVIVAGVRVATLFVIGIAAIAAYVNGPGLGKPIFSGLQSVGTSRGLDLALGGTLGIIVLAIVVDLAFAVVSKLTHRY